MHTTTSIYRISDIEKQAQHAAQNSADPVATCPYPPGTTAAFIFTNAFNAARKSAIVRAVAQATLGQTAAEFVAAKKINDSSRRPHHFVNRKEHA